MTEGVSELVERLDAAAMKAETVAGGRFPRSTTQTALMREAAKAITALTASLEQAARERDEARAEASTCDDINLGQPLAGIIADLQSDRERRWAELTRLRELVALAEKALEAVSAKLCETRAIPAYAVGNVVEWCVDECRLALTKLQASHEE